MKTKTILAVLLALLLPLSACSGDVTPQNDGTESGTDTENTQSTADSTSDAVPSETVRSEYADNLPDNLDFEGATFTVHYNDQNRSEWEYDEDTADIFDSAIYHRNLNTEDRLKVTIETYMSGSLSNYWSTAIPALRASIQAQDGAYDLIAGYQAYITRAGNTEFLYNLSGVKYLDFDQPWWNSSVQDALTINDRLFFMTGDLAVTYLQNMSGLLFNAQIAEDMVKTDLYECALSGNWTMDVFKQSISEGTKDLNGDGEIIDTDDQIGLTMFDRGSGILPFLASFGEKFTSRDENGVPQLDINIDGVQTALESVLDLLYYTHGATVPQQGYPTAQTNGLAKLANGSCLFMIGRIMMVEEDAIRNMKSEWGLLPIPKLDENQKEYGVWLTDAYSMFCIPKDVKDIDMACAVTESLAAESYRGVTETYYETCLKTRYMRSYQAVEVVEMLRSCIQVDFGYIYTKASPLPGFVNNLVLANNSSFSSWYASNIDSMKATFEASLEDYFIEE